MRKCNVSSPCTNKNELCGLIEAPVSRNNCTRALSANAGAPSQQILRHHNFHLVQ